MHPFRLYIAKYAALSEAEWEQIAYCLEEISVPRSGNILKEGQICRHLYFLEEGLLRFFVWKEGRDVNKYFTVAPYCFTSQRSFNFTIPAKENIEALEDSKIWRMSKEDSEELLQLPGWSEFVRKLVQEVQFYTDQILENIQNETAENRYRQMLAAGDPLLQRVPIKHIASYLGIAPQSLSRIRKKVLASTRK
ncbi:MAG: Crp/Fnr family transcriptional regulator [Bacteroidota bacterium]